MSAYLLYGWENGFQRLHKLPQCSNLIDRARVLWFLVAVKSTYIADSNCVPVVVFAVCALNVNRSALVDAPVQIDEIMIADVLPPIVVDMVFPY